MKFSNGRLFEIGECQLDGADDLENLILLLTYCCGFSGCDEDPYLARFQGKPQQISPKARFHTWMG
jgi:hypothetical protein